LQLAEVPLSSESKGEWPPELHLLSGVLSKAMYQGSPDHMSIGHRHDKEIGEVDHGPESRLLPPELAQPYAVANHDLGVHRLTRNACRKGLPCLHRICRHSHCVRSTEDPLFRRSRGEVGG